MIESRCVVGRPHGGYAGSFIGHEVDKHMGATGDMAKRSEVQHGFNRYHNITPLIPNSPVSITSQGSRKEAKGCL